AGRDSSQYNATPSDWRSERAAPRPAATCSADSGEGQCPNGAAVSIIEKLPGPYGFYSGRMEFRAYELTKHGEVIRPSVTTLDTDGLPAGDVLIQVAWSAINFKDAMVTRPGNRVARAFPLIPGVELAGTVHESTDPMFTEGQQVLVQGY